MSSHIKALIKEWTGLSITVLTLVTMLIGYVIYLSNLAKDVELIKENELVHIQNSLDKLEEKNMKQDDQLLRIERAVSNIEGLLLERY